MNIAELTSHFTPQLIARLVELAVNGGDVDRRMDKLLRGLARTGPEGTQFRSDVREAREAAKNGDSSGSVGRVVQLAEWMRLSGYPEVTALLCATAVNMVQQLGRNLDPEDAADLANITGGLAFDFHDYNTATLQYSRALELARETGNRTAEASFLLNLTNVARSVGEDAEAEGLALQGLAIAEELGDEFRQLQLLFTLGNMATDNGNLEAARQWLDAAKPLAKRLRQPGLTSGFHHLNGLIATRLGDHDTAEASWKRALAAARRTQDHDKEVASLQNLAAVAADAGKYSLALRRIRAAVEAAAGYRLVSRLTALLPALVRAEANNGNNAAALDAARRLLEISIATNTGVGEAHALLGAALVGSGHLEEGITELESAWHLLKDDRRSEADAARPHLIHNLIVAHANAQRLAQVWPDLAERAEQLEPTLATEALEVLGLQMLSQRDIPETDVAALLVRAVRRRKPADRAWTAATLAAQATDEGANHVAVELLNLALTTAARRKQETTLRHIRNDLALALTRTRNHQRARSLLNTNLTNADADDDSRTQWLALYNLAELSRRAGQQGDAEEFARRALDVAANANDTDSVNASRLQIGMTLSDIGRYDEAVTELTAVLRNVDPSSEEYAGAVHSLANIELGRGDVDSALRHYRTAVDHEARETIQATESLLGYAEALAASGKRRLFNRIFQRAIDSIDAVPYTNDLALRFTQIARRWARANKSRFAGEALATAILLPASVGQQRFKTAASDDADSVLEEAMFSVGAEIYYQTEIEPMGDVQLLLDATQMELRRLANASVAREAVRALRRIAKAMKAAD